MAGGRDLQEARERAGLTVEEASRRTRIPQRYLEALERGDLSAFPKGPFLAGYTRQYRGFLQLPEGPPPGPGGSVAPEATVPRGGLFGGARPEPGRSPVGQRDGHVHAGDARDGGAARTTLPRTVLDPATVPEATATGPAVPGSRTRRRATRLAALGALITVMVLLGVQLTRELWPAGEEAVGEAPDQHVSVAVVEPRRARIDVDGRRALDGQLKPGPARQFDGHDRISVELETLEGVTVGFAGRTLTPLGARSRPRRLVFIDDAGE